MSANRPLVLSCPDTYVPFQTKKQTFKKEEVPEREDIRMKIHVETDVELHDLDMISEFECPVPFRFYILVEQKKVYVLASSILTLCTAFNRVYLEVSSPCTVSYTVSRFPHLVRRHILVCMNQTGIQIDGLQYSFGLVSLAES